MMADDLGAAELGCYGHPQHETPHLDRLAAEGMRFRTCYAAPICSPSRVMIMTGRYGFTTGWYNFIGRAYSPSADSPLYDIGSAQLTFADMLKPRGYATALAGKWQLSGQLPTLVHDCGFDEYRMWAYDHNLPMGVKHTGRRENARRTARFWHPSIMHNGEYMPTAADDYGPDLLVEFIVDFMERHRDQPFCVYYPMLLTHKPWEETPVPGHPDRRALSGLKSNVEYLDHVIGQLVAALEKLGLREQTVVIFTGDNGTAGAGKGQATEAGARVPLIVSCPGTVQGGVVSDALADLSDVLPTVVEMAGATIPRNHHVDGRSMAPVLTGAAAEHRDWIFSFLGDRRILRDKRWLLDGGGTFYDCGDRRDGSGYRDVTDSTDSEVQAARERFAALLENLRLPDVERQQLNAP